MDGNMLKNVERFQELAGILEAEGFELSDLLDNPYELLLDDAEFFFKLAKKWDEEIYMDVDEHLAFKHDEREYLVSTKCGIQDVVHINEIRFKVSKIG